MFNVGDVVIAKEDGYPDVVGPIVSINLNRDWPIRVQTEKAALWFKPEQLTPYLPNNAVKPTPAARLKAQY